MDQMDFGTDKVPLSDTAAMPHQNSLQVRHFSNCEPTVPPSRCVAVAAAAMIQCSGCGPQCGKESSQRRQRKEGRKEGPFPRQGTASGVPFVA